jgi:hypothetical protein
MKITAQVLIIIFFVILFFIGLISATFKFGLLDYNFWQNSFGKHDVYQNLATVSKSSFESQINKEGGNKNDIRILTDLITPENAKDVVDNNLRNLLNFTNGASPQLNVYLPIDKVPKNLLPKNIIGIKSEMPIADLLAKFNFQNQQNLQLQNLSHLGIYATYFFGGCVFFLLLLLIFFILLTEKGKRFIGLGVAFVLSGSLTFFLANVGVGLNAVLSDDLINNSSITTVFAGTIFPPVIREILSVWQILGLILLCVGFILFFVRKPKYNNSK